MANEPDYSEDYLLWDWYEAISYFARATEAAPTTPGIPVANALRETLQKEVAGPNGAILHQETVRWHLPQAQLGDVAPKFGDVIQDATGKRYVIEKSVGVLEYEVKVFGMWKCPSRREY